MNCIPKSDQLQAFFQENEGCLKLPVRVKKNENIWDVLNQRWKQFSDLVEGTPWIYNIKHDVDCSIAEVNRAISNFFDGNMSDAIKSVFHLVEIASSHSPSYVLTSLKDFYGDCGEEWDEWYRVRSSDLFSLEKEKMSHIPFSKRAIIKNQRYSISGIPCLYLGHSIYGCWEEMHRPSLDSMCVSKFNLKSDIRLLNLSVTAQELLSQFAINEDKYPYENNVIAFFNAWILQSACSTIIEEEGRTFYEEYIIPQLLMQCLKSQNLDGILYFSTRVDNIYFNSRSFICKNIAIPATDYSYSKSMGKDYSEKIEEMFSWSIPVNIGLYEIGSSMDRAPSMSMGKAVVNRARTTASICLDKICKTNYRETIFYQLEALLHQNHYNQQCK